MHSKHRKTDHRELSINRCLDHGYRTIHFAPTRVLSLPQIADSHHGQKLRPRPRGTRCRIHVIHERLGVANRTKQIDPK